MADNGTDTTQAPRDGTARKPLGDAEIAALVDRLAPHLSGEMRPRSDLLPPDTRQIHERLRANPDGKVSAALNRLPNHHPAIVLADTVRMVLGALDQTRIEAATHEAVEKHRSIARHAQELAREIEDSFLPGGIIPMVRDLRRFAGIEDAYAEHFAEGLRRSRFSRKKANPRAAIIGASARGLAGALFEKNPVDREALRWLLGAALGWEISQTDLKAALRSDRPTKRHSDE